MAGQPTGQHREATRNDVARLAGVSTAVVSYVVNDGPRPVAPATRARVLDAIAKLGYRPNTVARSLITGKSGLIGLVVPDVENPYFASLARSVETAVADRDLDGNRIDPAVLLEQLRDALLEVVVRDVEVDALIEEPPVKRYGPVRSTRSCVGTMFLKKGSSGL